MKLLVKLLKYLLWLVLAAAFCAALTAAAWWMGWPLATGLVILLGIVAAVLVFVVCRALYRWRNKRVFVQSVLREQWSREDGTQGGDASSVTQVWRDGMAVFDGSPLRASLNPQYAQPWFLTLDDTTDARTEGATTSCSTLFSEFARRVPAQESAFGERPPLIWNFLPSAVLLQVPESGRDGENGPWETTLVLLARHARKMAMRGIVVLVSIKELRALPPDALRAKGQHLRQRLQQVMLTLSRRFPVYICVQDLECLSGMAELSGRLPVSVTDVPLGALLPEGISPGQGAAQATAAARLRLRTAMEDAAAEDIRPQGDELLALEELNVFTDPLKILLEQAFRSMPHQVSPLLRGVFFCHTHTSPNLDSFLFDTGPTSGSSATGSARALSASERPRYVAELFSHTIPEDPVAVKHLNSRFALYSSTKMGCMAAWLLVLFFVCGVFGVNTVYQYHVFTSHPYQNVEVTHNDAINRLYTQMNEILYLEKASKSWPLPFMGQNMLGMVEEKLKRNFLRDAYTDIFSPMMNSMQRVLQTADLTRNNEKQVDLIRQLVWMCSIVADRMEKGTISEMNVVVPLTRSNEALWAPVTGEIMRNALNWTTDKAELVLLSTQLQRTLTHGLIRDGGEGLQTLLQGMEPMVSGSRVCLSHYWTNLANSPDDVCVPGRYTRAGYAELVDTLNDILTVTHNTPEVKQAVTRYGSAYNREYWAAWHNFISKFNLLWMNRLSGENFAAYGELKRVSDLPQVQALQRLAQELAPLRMHETEPPAWLHSVALMDTMVSVAIASGKGQMNTTWDVMLGLVQSSSETLKTLQDSTRDTTHLRSTLQSIPKLRLYLDSVLGMLRQSTNPAQAFTLASLHFGNGDVSNSPFTEAEKLLEEALVPVKGDNSNPAKALMIGLLDFTRQAIIVQAARDLQHQWEAEVLSSPANLYRPEDIPALFGETGVVTVFINTRLKPFIKRQKVDFVPTVWARSSFPFTTDFLYMISRGEAVAAAPARSSYSVLLRSQPTLVNIEARERPDATVVTLQCTGKSTQLVNRNYPHDQTFEYDVEACGEAVLAVDFPSVKLQRRYANFADLLEEFQYGERNFGRDAFPESADKLASLLINDITVRLLPDNVADVLSRKNNRIPSLQDRITYVW